MRERDTRDWGWRKENSVRHCSPYILQVPLVSTVLLIILYYSRTFLIVPSQLVSDHQPLSLILHQIIPYLLSFHPHQMFLISLNRFSWNIPSDIFWWNETRFISIRCFWFLLFRLEHSLMMWQMLLECSIRFVIMAIISPEFHDGGILYCSDETH
jgi:hypothetical protein